MRAASASNDCWKVVPFDEAEASCCGCRCGERWLPLAQCQHSLRHPAFLDEQSEQYQL